MAENFPWSPSLYDNNSFPTSQFLQFDVRTLETEIDDRPLEFDA